MNNEETNDNNVGMIYSFTMYVVVTEINARHKQHILIQDQVQP